MCTCTNTNLVVSIGKNGPILMSRLFSYKYYIGFIIGTKLNLFRFYDSIAFHSQLPKATYHYL